MIVASFPGDDDVIPLFSTTATEAGKQGLEIAGGPAGAERGS